MEITVRRREFIVGLGSAAAWPVGVRAQKSALPIIGVLHSSTFTEARRGVMAALHQGLAETGYVEGRDVILEYRWAEDHYERLPELAADLLRQQVRLIVTLMNTPAALAAKAATQTIPIVFFLGVDPVEYGLVASWARPGGNVTGFTGFGTKLIAKRMQLLRELVPTATTIAYLFNPANFLNEIEDLQRAARILGVRVLMMEVSSEGNIEAAIENMAQQHAGALLVSADPVFFNHYGKIAAAAARYTMPSAFTLREAVEQGGLLSYGVSSMDMHRQVGVYVGRILNGEKPADLPVQQATKFEMAINLRTAKALGLTIPNTLLVGADEVIE